MFMFAAPATPAAPGFDLSGLVKAIQPLIDGTLKVTYYAGMRDGALTTASVIGLVFLIFLYARPPK